MKRRNIISRLRCLIYERNYCDEIQKLIRQNRFVSYVEIGVWCGNLAENIMNNCPTLEKMFLVDPYDKSTGKEWFYEKNTLNKAKEIMLRRVCVDKRVKFIQLESVVASKLFNEKSLDFVFIDGKHDFESVTSDIKSWYVKVREGGILAGHDYQQEGVKKAVNCLFKRKYIHLTDGGIWYIK